MKGCAELLHIPIVILQKLKRFVILLNNSLYIISFLFYFVKTKKRRLKTSILHKNILHNLQTVI